MKAVFESNPYKFWIDGDGGKLHVFDDNDAADNFTAVNEGFLCDSPNCVEYAETWAKLVIDYASCCGIDKVVLHTKNDYETMVDFIDCILDSCNDGFDANIGTHDATVGFSKMKFNDDTARMLFDLMFDLYDVKSVEAYDDNDIIVGMARSFEEAMA